MTWSRFREINEHWRYDPPVDALLAFIASAYGYKVPRKPKSGEEAARELRQMFPGGVIHGQNG